MHTVPIESIIFTEVHKYRFEKVYETKNLQIKKVRNVVHFFVVFFLNYLTSMWPYDVKQ